MKHAQPSVHMLIIVKSKHFHKVALDQNIDITDLELVATSNSSPLSATTLPVRILVVDDLSLKMLYPNQHLYRIFSYNIIFLSVVF